MSDTPHALVVGAGLAGSLMSTMLARRGWKVDVVERRGDLRLSTGSAGRSINLALSTRGVTALERVGLSAEVLGQTIPMRGRMMHDVHGTLTFQPYGQQGQAIQSVSRRGLNELLIDIAERNPNVTMHFNQRCVDVDLDAPSATFIDAQGQRVTRRADLLVGCDGIFSAVRGRMMRTDRFDYEQLYLKHGYKELAILPGADGAFQLEPEALHIWPRGDFMLIALPNLDRSFTCTLFHAYGGEDGFDALQTDAQVTDFFERQFPDVLPLMPNLLEDWRANPVSSLATIRCAPFHYGTTAVLVGDSAHAVVPFYGQGMNAAFESASLFDQLLERHGDDLQAALPAYTALRKADADAIRQLALDNFLEMRDHVADPEFLRRSAIEKRIQRASETPYLPLYSMVTFSNLPYAETIRRAKAQSAWLSDRLSSVEGTSVDEASDAFISLLLREPPPVFSELS